MNLTDAIKAGHLGIVKEKVEEIDNIDENPMKSNDYNLLAKACIEGQFRIVKYLVESGANVNIPSGDDGCYPIQLALYYGFFDIVEYLIKNCATIDCTDADGIGIADDAYNFGIEAIEFLLKYKDDLSTETEEELNSMRLDKLFS